MTYKFGCFAHDTKYMSVKYAVHFLLSICDLGFVNKK